MQNINRVVVSGNLTRDPELRQTQGGTTVCSLRIAVNGRIKQGGEWQDKANYFDVSCFGALADNVKKYLSKGSGLMVDGRLDWREWEQDGNKRQAVQIIADTIQFLGGRSESNGGNSGGQQPAAAPVSGEAPPPDDDDIPF